jgi:nucleosome binding factor SPN SPT16 subunit
MLCCLKPSTHFQYVPPSQQLSVCSFACGVTQVTVDNDREAVLVPIYGIMVPIHIMAVKTATVNVENDTALIRISFNFG